MTSVEAGPSGLERRLYVATVAVTAACGLIVEIVAGRMLAPYLGMSLYTWTAIIAVVLAGFSVGHWVGGLLADRPDGSSHRRLACTLFLCAVSTAASLILIRILSAPIINLALTPVPTIVLLTSALFFLPSFLVGIPSPVLTKLAIAADPARTGRIVGNMFAAGALGSIVGTLAAGFLFISWLGSIGTILLVAGVYLALSLVFFALVSREGKGAVILPVLALVGAGILLGLVGRQVSAFTPNCTTESSYYCIRVIDISAQTGTSSKVMVLDHLGHGMNIADAPGRFLSSYVELTDRLAALHTEGRTDLTAYFVGGGAYTLPRAWAARKPPITMTVAEVDPKVTELAERDMWLQRSETLTVRHDDARAVLRKEPGKRFDVVVGDAFHDIAVPQHLVTREFFSLVKSRLRDKGIYVMTAVDRAKSPRLMLSLVKTLGDVFPVVEIWLDAEQAAEGGRSTFILLAGTTPTPSGTLRSQTFPDRQWRRWSADETTALAQRLNPKLLTDDFAPVDRLLGAY